MFRLAGRLSLDTNPDLPEVRTLAVIVESTATHDMAGLPFGWKSSHYDTPVTLPLGESLSSHLGWNARIGKTETHHSHKSSHT